ncbi:30S ribosomal protein S6 [Protomyces lactucae-debilis]|uniref:30S ribosomal protein S6 n=1 Tax=Protomyces lactucae-debilis TaxID=2754530 RepID=A0A1Y2FUM1_PROLT|nr:30S ribosomal protein S6 [Protomyces lactucae-debilis]ORY87692.1 30S ribosomal protein S6 [Protomyces lactucae-debilis]
MVLYELICITRSSLPEATLREIAKTAGSQVVQNGGVVRSPVKKYQATYDDGNYMIMKFDTNPRVQKDVSLTIKLDPRVLRHSIVKLGDKLDELH